MPVRNMKCENVDLTCVQRLTHEHVYMCFRAAQAAADMLTNRTLVQFSTTVKSGVNGVLRV